MAFPLGILVPLLLCLAIAGDGKNFSSRLFNEFDEAYNETICSGSSNGGSTMGATATGEGGRLNRLRKMYENCSRVMGNLEITGVMLEDIVAFGSANFSFLSSIREVSGYVLISQNMFRNLTIPNLQVIKGDEGSRTSPNHTGFALDVYNNPNLEFLSLPSLRVIQDKDVHLYANPYLCSWPSIDWTSIFHHPKEQKYLVKESHDECRGGMGDCWWNCSSSEVSGERRCWGPLEGQCQDLYKAGCSASCSSSGGQCWRPGGSSKSCCHHSCVGGCTGPKNSQCVACATLENDGGCVDSCPPLRILDRYTNSLKENPEGRYANRHRCVEKCPSNLLVVENSCVSQCPEGMYAPGANAATLEAGPFPCVPCGDTCPKSCEFPSGDTFVHADNVKVFVNCTDFNGDIIIRKDSFTESSEYNAATGVLKKTKPVSRKDLEAMSSLRKVSGSIFIQSPLKDVDFLRNLEMIEGRTLMSGRFALDVSGNRDLRSLGLISLKAIRDGDVHIHTNNDLCFIHKVNWSRILVKPTQGWRVEKIRPEKVCEGRDRLTCDAQCEASEGCWSAGPAACLQCRNFTLSGICVGQCRLNGGQFLEGPGRCADCHPECETCEGAGPRNCTACRHFQMEDGECVAQCPRSHYAEGYACLPCHNNCANLGCSGPSPIVGQGGCQRCFLGAQVELDGRKRLECLPDSVDSSQKCTGQRFERFYSWPASSSVWSREAKNDVCLPCDETCDSCSGPGTQVGYPSFCTCASHQVNWSEGAECSTECPAKTFPLFDNSSESLFSSGEWEVRECGECDAECASGCVGPLPSDCVGVCVNFKLLHGDGSFECVVECPEDLPFVFKGECSDVDMAALDRRRLLYILFGVGAALVLLLFLAVSCFLYRHKFITLKRQYTEIDVPDTPGYKPNMSRLRIIKATELRRGGKLGEGAFGVVFRGVYRPEGESVKVPVAIKQLTRSSPETEKEMLEEATHMGSLSHPHLVRLVGISVSQKILLVTPLMPLGNLRDYIKNNQGRIGSHAILKWAHQIAQGMEHLEENRLVHRDLAARNVLVRNPGHVAVTDFGLAKMLDYGEKEVFVEGRVPVKWLALESIEQRRFTHKSDVWAYGVTLWEILSFGRHPYENVPIQSIPKILRDGERLEQPETCSLNLYMLLIRCWVIDAGSRPSFAELVHQVGEFLKTPSSYVTIPNDKLLRLPSASPAFLDDTLFSGEGTVVDPINYFDSTGAPSEPDLNPTSPTSPTSKPLMWSGRNGGGAGRVGGAGPSRHSSVGSRRYASDPLGRSPKHLASTTEEEGSVATDADNYLQPNSAFPAPPSYTPQAAYTKVLPSGQPQPTYYNDAGRDGEVALENLEYLAPSPKDIVESETVV